MEGFARIFEELADPGHIPILPVFASMEQLLSSPEVAFLVIDLNSAPAGLETLEAIRSARPDLRLIVIGPESNENLMMDSIVAGARAYLDTTADPEIVRRAIEAAIGGSIWAPRRVLSRLIDRLLQQQPAKGQTTHLTEREREVLELILLARSNREIAEHLGIEERTVKAHVGRLMRKTGAENRIGLSLRALNQSLIPGPGSPDRRMKERRAGWANRASAPPSD
jgi:DNA-binding NarL/FixJ family response regulator